MKVLFLTHTFPYPIDDGVKLHVYHLLRQLSRRHEVSLFSLIQEESERRHVPEILGLGVRQVEVCLSPVPRSLWRRAWNVFFEREPFYVRQFYSPGMAVLLERRIRENPPDVLHVDYLSMALYRPLFPGVPAVCFPHDAVSMLFERNARAEPDFLRRLYTRVQWRKTLRFESDWLSRFDGVAVVSPVDREYLRRHCPELEIEVAPNGVDGEYFHPFSDAVEEPSILFRGVMSFLPNEDAASYFYKEILPRVRRSLPQTKFYIVGKEPGQFWIRQAQRDPLLQVTGFAQDLRPWMARAGVIVVPMRIGPGIKNKILEPMAMAKTVVATPMSCAAIEARDGEHLFLAEGSEEFAQKVLRLRCPLRQTMMWRLAEQGDFFGVPPRCLGLVAKVGCRLGKFIGI